MELQSFVDDINFRIAQAAELGGAEARALAERLVAPVDAAVRLSLIDALGVAVREISADLAPGSVDLRLSDGEPLFVVDLPDASPEAEPETAAPAAAPLPLPTSDETGTTRTTLRLPDHLKNAAEAAAAADGVSVNTWLVRAVAAALSRPSQQAPAPVVNSSRRVTGWV